MNIQNRIDRLCSRMHQAPQYPNQGAVQFVDLTNRESHSAYFSSDVASAFLGGRGANMYLLYNLLDEGCHPLDPQVPLIFGAGILTGFVPGAPRGNVSSLSPDSRAILDANAGDFFPSFMRRHGIDHLVLYGKAPSLTLLHYKEGSFYFDDATPYSGLNNQSLTEQIESHYHCKEGKDMALARITQAGENQVLTSGIMGGEKSIWARGGGGAKMGSMQLKALLIEGDVPKHTPTALFRSNNKAIGKKILSTSVVKNVLKKVGTPFLYKASRTLHALGALNNQKTQWSKSLDAENLTPYKRGMTGCYKCPVHCRMLNQLDEEGAAPGTLLKGDGPEYVTVGKFGPNLGISDPQVVVRLNNRLNDLGLDSASTGGALAWAFELYQRGIITTQETGGLVLEWGDGALVEQLLEMTAARKGFGSTIAESGRAVEKGCYPDEALDYRMAVKGLFQSDPHDSRIIKAFALGLAVATRGMDHLRNRVTLEINPRINDDPDYKKSLYGGMVDANPASYNGKEYAVSKCEQVFAAGDAAGMCRFNTKLFNSPSLPHCGDFAVQLKELTGLPFTEESVESAGQNINLLERLINFRIGLRASDDTLPDRWFNESIKSGPYEGEKIERSHFDDLIQRYYSLIGVGPNGMVLADKHRELAEKVTGFWVNVQFPDSLLGGTEIPSVFDEPVENIVELRERLIGRYPILREPLDDELALVVVNGETIFSGESEHAVKSGDSIEFVHAISGG